MEVPTMQNGMRALCLAAMLALPVLAQLGFAQPAAAQSGDLNVPPGYEQAPPPLQPPVAQPHYQVVPQYPAATQYPAAPTAQARLVEVERSSSLRGLWLPGIIVLPITWATTATVASALYLGDAATFGWIPVFGPWLMLTQDVNGADAMFILSGVLQGASALAIVLGLSLKRTWTEQRYVIDPGTGATAALRFDVRSLPGGGMIDVQLEL